MAPASSNTPGQPAHSPVLLGPAVDLLGCAPGKIIVDATVGGGGHAQRILELIGESGVLIGLDRDDAALTIARRRLGRRPNLKLIQEDFRHLARVLDDLGAPEIDGLLLDLGISSFQVDDPQRGFSFRLEGPLDMRMDPRQSFSAADIINTYSEEQIFNILRVYGEEPFAKKIARAVVVERKKEPIRTTTRLADLVQKAIPRGRRPARIHPATRTFQALRIEVNSELESLERALDDGIARLKEHGRVCVISFHSLEDRIVKRKFAVLARGCVCPSDAPICVCGKKPILKILTSKPIEPSAEEVSANPRSRSARLRAAEKKAVGLGS